MDMDISQSQIVFLNIFFLQNLCKTSDLRAFFAGFWQVGIMNHLMGAGGPHWCEDPVVDRENQVGARGVMVGSLGW